MLVGAAARKNVLKAAVLGALLAVAGGGAAQADSVAVQAGPAGRVAVAPAASFPDASLTLTRQRDGVTMRLDGIVTPAVEKRFIDALRALPPDQPMVLELASPGGYTAAGYRMIDAILAERQAGRPVATRVKAGEACESMCVGLYLSGYPRYAAPSAEFMVHAPRGAQSGTMTLRSTRTMVKRLVDLGAARGWIEKVKAAGGFSGNIDYRERADSLAATRANIVTDLIR